MAHKVAFKRTYDGLPLAGQPFFFPVRMGGPRYKGETKETTMEPQDQWVVRGDHPIAARPDKTFHGDNAVIDSLAYEAYLKREGFENVKREQVNGQAKEEIKG